MVLSPGVELEISCGSQRVLMDSCGVVMKVIIDLEYTSNSVWFLKLDILGFLLGYPSASVQYRTAC